MRFDWDANNRKKVLNHGVSPREFEEAHSGRILQEQNLTKKERRKVAMGQTEAGRVLTLVYTIRRGKVRPVTAWESRKARASWREK